MRLIAAGVSICKTSCLRTFHMPHGLSSGLHRPRAECIISSSPVPVLTRRLVPTVGTVSLGQLSFARKLVLTAGSAVFTTSVFVPRAECILSSSLVPVSTRRLVPTVGIVSVGPLAFARKLVCRQVPRCLPLSSDRLSVCYVGSSLSVSDVSLPTTLRRFLRRCHFVSSSPFSPSSPSSSSLSSSSSSSLPPRRELMRCRRDCCRRSL